MDYLIKLGIYCKLYDKEFSIHRNRTDFESFYFVPNDRSYEFRTSNLIRDNFEDLMMQKKERLCNKELPLHQSHEFDLAIGDNKLEAPSMSMLKEAIISKFSSMNYDDIKQSGLSTHEYRKIIGMKYENIELSDEELVALQRYKAGWYVYINGFLRGDYSFLIKNDSEKIKGENQLKEDVFVQEKLPEIIDNVNCIYNIGKKFMTDRELTVKRKDSRIDNNIEEMISYDNFVSTTGNGVLFDYRLEGIKGKNELYINIPKGSHVIPMDVLRERQMDKLKNWNEIEWSMERSKS